jgi:DNA-binding transcriptional LysR family regulator
MTVNLNRLRIFHVAAGQASFTAAADALHLTQPGVSKHIKELELHYGQPLFDRLGKTVRLTQAGEVLLRATTDIFRRLDEAQARIDDLGQAIGGCLRIGASNSIGACLLPQLLARFSRSHPRVELAIDVGLSGDIENKLLDHALDIGLLGHAPRHPDLTVRAFAQDRLVLVVPPGHDWAGRRVPVAPAELAQQVFLVSKAGSGTRKLVEALLAAADVALARIQDMGSTEGVKKSVEAGLGISLLSNCVVRKEVAAGWLRAVPIAGLPTERTYWLAHHRDRYLPAAARAFSEMDFTDDCP